MTCSCPGPCPCCSHWQHHSMWWPRLFKHHGEIAWDDYEKDYSDLPAEVLRRHRQEGRSLAWKQRAGSFY